MRIIADGGGCCRDEFDEMTALKFPHMMRQMDWVRIESRMLDALGRHPRIVESKDLRDNGLLLELTKNGDLLEYLTAHPEVCIEQPLACCMQAAEAAAYIHSERVLHCIVRHNMFLLDSKLDPKRADFQDQHFQ